MTYQAILIITVGTKQDALGKEDLLWAISDKPLTTAGTRQGTHGMTSATAGLILIGAITPKPGGRSLGDMGTVACMNFVCFACRRS